MIDVNGRIHFTKGDQTVTVGISGTGETAEAALEAALSDGNWREGIAAPVQEALEPGSTL